MEIERRWLVSEEIGSILENNSKHSIDISQYYIVSEPNISVRVRREIEYFSSFKENYYQTIKKGSGLSREEYEFQIPQHLYVEMKKESKFGISKRRIIISSGDFKFELDCFNFDSKTHYQVEVEFKSEEESQMFEVPSWFGKEVTTDKRYLNAVLGEKGLPNED